MSIHRIGWLLASVGMVVVVWLAGYGLVVGEGAKGAVVWCTRPDGASGCQTTIQAAVDLASDGDGVLIAAGVYTENVVITKSLVMTGGWVPAGWTITETIISPTPKNDVSCLVEVKNVTGKLSGIQIVDAPNTGLCLNKAYHFTIDNLQVNNSAAQGLYLQNTGAITVTNSIFIDNSSRGLLANCREATLFLDNNLFANNRVGIDVGVNCIETEITNNLVSGNAGTGLYLGGSPLPANHYLTYTSDVVFVAHNIISGNEGLGIFHWNRDGLLLNNILQSNRLGIFGTEAVITSSNNLIVDNRDEAVHLSSSIWHSTNDTLYQAGEAVIGFSYRDFNYCIGSIANLTNTIVWGDGIGVKTLQESSSCNYSPEYEVIVQNSLVVGLADLLTEPFMIVGEGVSGVPPYFGAGYVPQIPSLAIDGGTSVGAPLVDFYGTPRPVDGDGNGVARVDIGAIEAPAGIIYRIYHPLINDN